MTKLIVNIGDTANDRNADSLRTAFTKINENFSELYTTLGLDDTTLNLGAFEFNGSVISTTDSTAITIDQATTVTSGLTVGGDILPIKDLGGSLGSPTHQWSSLYVSTNTIYINNIPLSLDVNNNILVNNNPISSTIEYNNIPNAPTDISDLTDSTGLLEGIGAPGPQGPQGELGSTGPSGSTGPQGPTGPAGSIGPTGATGPKGDKGDQGVAGSIGAQGSPGAKGDTGNTGAQGVSVTLLGTLALIADLSTVVNPLQGDAWIVTESNGGDLYFRTSTGTWDNIGKIVGPQGDQGAQGVAGSQGAQGAQGPAGNDGALGATGATGPQGNPGPTGPQGEVGQTGPQGPTGDQGPAGPAGTGLTGWTVDINNNLVPNTDILQDLGSPTNRLRHIYVGPGSITVGSSVITESTTGKLVLPGITRGVNYSIDEVEEKGEQTYTFAGTPVVIDAAYFAILSGTLSAPQGYVAPQYAVDDIDDGEIDGISVVSQGSGLDQTVANKMREQMRAYNSGNPDPFSNFQTIDWVAIPFTVSTEAADIEYENSGAGDRLVNGQAEMVMNSDGDVTMHNGGHLDINGGSIRQTEDEDLVIRVKDADDDGYRLDLIVVDDDDDTLTRVEVHRDGVEILTNLQGQDGAYGWHFRDNGNLQLPAGGDIVDPNGTSVLGGAADTGNITFTENEIGSTGGIVNINADDYAQLQSGGNYIYVQSTGAFIEIGQHTFEFDVRGALRLPVGGDILDNNGTSVLGGAYTLPTASDSVLGGIKIGTGLSIDVDGVVTAAAGDTTVARQATPPTADNGTLWFNTVEGRLYIKYSDVWVDAAPLVMPAPDMDIDVVSITFPDATVQTTAIPNKLVNGVHEVVLGANGTLTVADDIILPRTGRIIKDCDNRGGTTSQRWINIPTIDDEQEIQLLRVYTGDPADDDNTDRERATISLEWQTATQSGLSITAFDRTDGSDEHKWEFKGDGNLELPGGQLISGGNSARGIALTTDRGTVLFGNIPEVGPTGSTHFHIMKDSSSTDLFFGDDYNYVKLPSTSGVEVGANGSIWTFGTTGRTTFPNGVVPEHSYGAAGDKEGMVVFSDPYIYYCKQDYVDDVTDIWVRVAWTGTNW